MTARITSDQKKQYWRFIQDAANRALKEAAPDKDGLQRLFASGGKFQAHVVAGIQRFSAKGTDYDQARTILGSDFISPQEITKSRGVIYTDEQLAKLGDTLPGVEALQWCRDNDMILVAGPPTAMSLLQIRTLNSSYFHSKDPSKDNAAWYDDAKQKFAREDKTEPVWIALRKEPVPDSLGRNWSEQNALVAAPMTVPNAAEAAWCLTNYSAIRGVFLLPSLYVRTSSMDSVGNRVDVGHVGDFGGGGLSVNYYWGGLEDSDIGISGARKFR